MHPTTTRKSSLMSNPRLQPTVRRKARERQRETALCVASLGIGPRTVLSAKTGSLPTWSLARAEEHRGRERFLLVDGKRVACGCSWCWYGQSEVYFGKDRAAEERAACPFNKEESC
uniref:Uncharacterized protein n=1 Tax=Oryza sativa subsp. japonica TaxID=39947 RepID=Q8W5P7_ORYSJ|nr:unknown protein [Oryza sativa Japonica Group]